MTCCGAKIGDNRRAHPAVAQEYIVLAPVEKPASAAELDDVHLRAHRRRLEVEAFFLYVSE